MAVDVRNTQVLGIFQSDVIIRSAIIAGIIELRQKPWLLDYCFAGLAQDDLTKKEYGEKQIEQAKQWFLKTDIPVFLDVHLDHSRMPAISIKLISSAENINTLGDVNPQAVSESFLPDWPTLAGPFAAASYDASTGLVVLPEPIVNQLVIVSGMNVVDANGKVYEILDVVAADTIKITPKTAADFSKAFIKSAQPTQITTIESCINNETYRIGCHALNEHFYCTYLWSITLFVLARGRQSLLEARGFEGSSFTATSLERNPALSESEIGYSRFIDVTGRVRQYWPKSVVELTRAVDTAIAVGYEGSIEEIVDEDQDTLTSSLWVPLKGQRGY